MSQDSTPAAGSAIWQHRQDQAHHCSIFQRGLHRDGTFIRVFVPDAARQPGAELRVILYLHGFALCINQIDVVAFGSLLNCFRRDGDRIFHGIQYQGQV